MPKTTRSGSTATREKPIDQTKREFYLKAMKRNAKMVNDEAVFTAWSKGMIEERLISFEENYKKFELHCVNIECNDWIEDEEAESDMRIENDIMELEYYAIKAKLRDRLAELEPKVEIQPKVSEPVRVEVTQNDALSNIPDTWGKFNGDYSKWQSFRDRFKAAIHDSERVKPIFKFQYLQTACVGEAKGALGEWDLTEANYEKAWNRLQAIYEDDYMQVQSFMRKLHSIPRIEKATSKGIRDLIDTVHTCVHGLSRYIPMESSDAFIVFWVIDRMDRDTYRAWEKHRPTLSVVVEQAQENEGAQRNVDKHIPTWRELETFLEGEVTIHVHDEKRSEASSTVGEMQNMSLNPSGGAVKKQQMQQTQHKAYPIIDKHHAPDFLSCVLCDGVHPIYKCNKFKALDLTRRRKHVIQNGLCERCLRQNHPGDCKDPKSMEQCPDCRKGVKHNSWLCPTKEAKMLEARMARKRESSNDSRSNV